MGDLKNEASVSFLQACSFSNLSRSHQTRTVMWMLKVVVLALFVTLATSVTTSDSPSVKCIVENSETEQPPELTPVPTIAPTPEPTAEESTPESTVTLTPELTTEDSITPEPTTKEPLTPKPMTEEPRTPKPTTEDPITPEPTPEACEICNNVEYINGYYPRGQLLGFDGGVHSAGECCELCRRTTGCEAFWLSSWMSCYFVSAVTETVVSAGAVSGIMSEEDTCGEPPSTQPCTPEEMCAAISVSEGLAFPVFDVNKIGHRYGLPSIDDCCYACASLNWCTVYQYANLDQTCIMGSDAPATLADAMYSMGTIGGCPAD